jgi:hypothetical protein
MAKLTGRGLPAKPVGKVMPAFAPSNPRRIYATIETGDGVPWKGATPDRGQIWRSDDGGDNWRVINTDRNAYGPDGLLRADDRLEPTTKTRRIT